MENKMKLQQEEFEGLIARMLEIMDPTPSREGLQGTPHRVWKYWNELLEGQWVTNEDIANDPKYNKCFTNSSKDLVVEKDIYTFSHCEHHLALMYDIRVSIGYIPNGKVIGLSKMGRIVEICAKRLQLQEKLTQDIFEVLKLILNTEDIIVVTEGKHGCMTARGIKSREALTKVSSINGLFRVNDSLRKEFYSLIK